MQEDYLRICAKVDLDAVRENVENMRANLAPGTRMMAVVKTDGYGHGAVPLARELEPLDFLFGFAVATAGEALELRRAGIRKPVLVLGYTFPESYKRLIEEEVRFTVFLPQTLKELAQAARELAAAQKAGERQRQAYIHIKVDTGMNRIGVKPDEEGFRLVRKALDIPEIRVEGIFTHFARADEKDKGPALHQFTTAQTAPGSWRCRRRAWIWSGPGLRCTGCGRRMRSEGILFPFGRSSPSTAISYILRRSRRERRSATGEPSPHLPKCGLPPFPQATGTAIPGRFPAGDMF